MCVIVCVLCVECVECVVWGGWVGVGGGGGEWEEEVGCVCVCCVREWCIGVCACSSHIQDLTLSSCCFSLILMEALP